MAICLESARGVNFGVGFEHIKRVEDSVRAGRHALYTASFQTYEVLKTVQIANYALSLGGAKGVPLVAKCVVYLTPAVLSYLTKMGLENGFLRSTFIFLQDHVGTLCHLASVVSSVAMLCLGHQIVGAVSLACLAIGFMDRIKVLPEDLRHMLHEMSPHIVILTGLVAGGFVDQLYSLFNIALYLAKPHEKRGALTEVPQDVLTPVLFKKIVREGASGLSVNKEYVKIPTMPQVPDVDLACFLDESESMDWKKHIDVLRKKLQGDMRFVDREGCPYLATDEKIITYCKMNVRSCILGVKEKRVLTGEPLDYRLLTEYLKVIAHAKKGKEDFLIRLGIEGGEYCGSSIYSVIEKSYESVVEEVDGLSLRKRVLNRLQTDRSYFVEKAYNELLQYQQTHNDLFSSLLNAVDLLDRHNFTQFATWYFEEAYFRNGYVEDDSISVVEPLEKILLMYLIGDRFEGRFWQEHTAEHVIESVQKGIGPSLPKHEVYNWIKDQMAPDWGEDNLLVYGVSIEDEKGVIHPHIIAAMLFDMGILI